MVASTSPTNCQRPRHNPAQGTHHSQGTHSHSHLSRWLCFYLPKPPRTSDVSTHSRYIPDTYEYPTNIPWIPHKYPKQRSTMREVVFSSPLAVLCTGCSFVRVKNYFAEYTILVLYNSTQKKYQFFRKIYHTLLIVHARVYKICIFHTFLLILYAFLAN